MVPPGREPTAGHRASLSARADELDLVDPNGIFHFTLRFEDTDPI
jgi:hypothetical protein